MKRILILLLTISFIGCSDDDNNSLELNIVGKWRSSTFTDDNGTTYDATNCEKDPVSSAFLFFEFKDNGVMSESNPCWPDSNQDGNYTFTKNTLTYSLDEFETYKCSVNVIDNNKFKFYSKSLGGTYVMVRQ